MIIKAEIYDQILCAFPAVPPESGCILGVREDSVDCFVHDYEAPTVDRAIYTPNIEVLNQVIAQWAERGIRFCGLAHSHPHGQESLSSGDVHYINTIMQAMPVSMKYLYFPLVFPGEKMVSFIASRNQRGLYILPDEIIMT